MKPIDIQVDTVTDVLYSPSLKRWGTIAFDSEFMRKTIGFGVPIFSESEFKGFDAERFPNSLCLSVWLSFVPECYRDQCESIAIKTVNDFAGERIVESTLTAFISRLKGAIEAEVQPI